MKAVHAVRRSLPKAPAAPVLHIGGRLCDKPPTCDQNDAANQRWHWRQLHRRKQIVEVHALAQQGLSQRAISQQTGHHRATVKRWLAQAIPTLPVNTPTSLSDIAALPGPQQRREQRRRLLARVHTLAKEGLSDSAIARQTGIHRLTVKKWAACPPPWAAEEPTPATPETESPPPTGWLTWEEVRHVREALQKHRFLLMRRPDHLNAEEQAQIDELLASPVGHELRVIRNFVVGWFQLLYNEHGQRRTVDDARSSFIAWQTNPNYASNPQLQRVMEAMTAKKFAQLSHFLRNAGWEATNNGAERTARTFRHQQAAHFNLRSADAISAAVGIAAHLQHEKKRQPESQPIHTCQRGRHRRADRAGNQPETLMGTATLLTASP
jgi:transposase